MPRSNKPKRTLSNTSSNASSSSSFVSVDTAISSDTSPPGSPKNRTSVPRSRIPVPSISSPRGTRDTSTILKLARDLLEEAENRSESDALEIRSQRAQISRLLKEIEGLKNDKEEAEKERDTAVEQNRNLSATLKEQREEITRQRSEKEAYCIKKEDELRTARDKASHLQVEHETLQKKYGELETELKLEKSITAQAIKAKRECDHDLDLAHEAGRELKAKCLNLEMDNASLQSQIQHSKERVLRLTTYCCALRWRNMVLLRNLQQTKAGSDELKTRCDKLENEQKEKSVAKKLNDKLQAELQALSTHISQMSLLEKNHNHLREEHDTLETRHNELQASHASVQMQVDKIREENASLQRQIRYCNKNRLIAFMRYVVIRWRESMLSTRLQQSTAECERLRGTNNHLETVNMWMERQSNRDHEVIYGFLAFILLINRLQQQSYERQPDEQPITGPIQAQLDESNRQENESGQGSLDRGRHRYVYTRERPFGRHGM
ncbi:hypothetical protein CDV55_103543 [Aspergillus turcosus]|nr:hypothetical protein CDV55_103543 [Aspergillus turcosus]